MNAIASEAFLARRRTAVPVLGALWLILVTVFGYGVPYVVYRTLDDDTSDRGQLLEQLSPAVVDVTALSNYPLFGGAVMVILGVLSTGSEYRWNTWTSRLTQGPGRGEVVVAKVVVAMAAAAGIATAAFVLSCLLSTAVALVEGKGPDWPAVGEVLVSLAAAALICGAWTAIGAALGIVCRGTGLAFAVGLFWTLAFENVVSGLAIVWPALEPVRLVLLGPASGSLVAHLGGTRLEDGGSPGVVEAMSGPVAVGTAGRLYRHRNSHRRRHAAAARHFLMDG